MSRHRRGPDGHGYARKFVRRGPPRSIGEALPEEEGEHLTGRALWEAAMEGPADDPSSFAACVSVLSMLIGHLAEGIIAVQEEKGTGQGVLEAWEALDEEEDLLALRATILVIGERMRLLVEALGVDTDGWLDGQAG